MLDKIRAFLSETRKLVDSLASRSILSKPIITCCSIFGTIPDPDLLLQQAGIARWQLRRLELDDEIAGRLEDRVSGLIATPWAIEPSTTRAAKFVKEQLTGLWNG